MIDFHLDISRAEQLEKSMSRLADHSEDLTNKRLRTKGTKIMIEEILHMMPISNKKKKHAKNSNPIAFRMINLGFYLYTKGGAANNPGSFGYLVFPEEGRGPRNHFAQRFFERGMEKGHDKVVIDLIDALNKAHEILN